MAWHVGAAGQAVFDDSVDPTHDGCVFTAHGPTIEIVLERARMGAAAPEMLEALQAEDAARVAANDYPPGDTLGMDRAMRARARADTLRRAAIAKATRKAP